MKKSMILMLLSNRKEEAEKVQKVLTDWGCLIKTRLGVHDGVLDNCSNAGLIFLELVGEDEKNKELCHKLDILPGVSAKFVELETEEA